MGRVDRVSRDRRVVEVEREDCPYPDDDPIFPVMLVLRLENIVVTLKSLRICNVDFLTLELQHIEEISTFYILLIPKFVVLTYGKRYPTMLDIIGRIQQIKSKNKFYC